MGSGMTNRGKYLLFSFSFVGGTVPTNYYVYSVNSIPTPDTNILSELTDGSFYSPVSLTPGGTDFDVLTEDDTGDQAYVQVKDIVITASGGTHTATYAVLVDDNVTPGNRQVLAYWDYGSTQNIPDGSTLTLTNLQLTLT